MKSWFLLALAIVALLAFQAGRFYTCERSYRGGAVYYRGGSVVWERGYVITELSP